MFLSQLRHYQRSLTSLAYNKMRVIPIPCLSDNYAYLLIDPSTKLAAAIDPVEYDRVLNAVKEHGCQLTTVLTTHHHYDHAGGNARLVKKVKDVQVYGGDERIPALTHPVQDGAVFKLGTLEIQALHTPCHTTGHICYYVKGNNERVVFTGDTLFIGGCGRFFEGTAEQMLNSLDKLARLPPDTKVYCGHEYTLSNLAFAHSVDPNNKDLEEKIQFAKHTKCTVPSTIASELTYNPFMRTREIALQKATGQTDPVKVMAVLREMKNNFKG